MLRVVPAFIVCLVLLAGLEFWLRADLFDHASYSNSRSIDRQLNERDSSEQWNQLFVGDSEVHWGIHPGQVDVALTAAGLPSHAFNHAFDGFGASWWPLLLPPLLEEPALRHVGVVTLGVQLIDAHRLIDRRERECGALQKPVLTSPFAIDLGIDDLCRAEGWDATLGRRAFGPLWVVRYASAVRSAVLPAFMSGTGPIALNSRSSGQTYHGFEPHLSIATEAESYEREFARWKAQYDAARDFQPLPPDVWPKLLAPSGFLDEFRRVVESGGRKLALFALPTNPAVIDTFKRRNDYLRNSALLRKWATERGVVYVDIGIRDVPDAQAYFSDMRHLSGDGAKRYSRELGTALAAAFSADPAYARALSGARP